LVALFKGSNWIEKVMKGDYDAQTVQEIGIEAGQCIDYQGSLEFLNYELKNASERETLGFTEIAKSIFGKAG